MSGKQDPEIGKAFVVAAEIGRYLRFEKDLDLLGTEDPTFATTPSVCDTFFYKDADQAARYLRSAGWRDAHVCDLRGFPATLEVISDNQPYVVRFHNREHFFVARREEKIVFTVLPYEARALTRDVAFEIVSRLKNEGVHDAEVIPHTYQIKNVEDEFESAWGTRFEDLPIEEPPELQIENYMEKNPR